MQTSTQLATTLHHEGKRILGDQARLGVIEGQHLVRWGMGLTSPPAALKAGGEPMPMLLQRPCDLQSKALWAPERRKRQEDEER